MTAINLREAAYTQIGLGAFIDGDPAKKISISLAKITPSMWKSLGALEARETSVFRALCRMSRDFHADVEIYFAKVGRWAFAAALIRGLGLFSRS